MLSKSCGLCFLLQSKLKKENLSTETKFSNNPEDRGLFTKYNIKSTPRLLVIHESGDLEIIQGVEDIIKEIKNDQN